MEKKKIFILFLYLISIVFLPWWFSLSFQKSLESWVTNWWKTKQSETFLNDIQDFLFAHNDQVISSLVSTFPVLLDTILKYWIFRYLNSVSPSLVVIYHSMND